MASLLKDPLFKISGRGPPPNTTFFYFAVTKSEVIWRWWKISSRAVDRQSRPGEEKESHQKMLEDKSLQNEIAIVFGQEILEYAKTLCLGHYNYLELLSDSLLLHIINYLELEEVGQLACTSRKFRQLCQSEEFWEKAVRQRCQTVSDEVSSLAFEIGWRRLFFTNKLQLQMLINRRRMKLHEELEDQGCNQETRAGQSPDGKSLETQEEDKCGSSTSLSLESTDKYSTDGPSPIPSLDSDDSLPSSFSDPASLQDDDPACWV